MKWGYSAQTKEVRLKDNYLNMKSLLVTVCSWVCPDRAVWSGVIKTYFFPNNDFSELALSSYFTLWLQPLPSDQVVSVKTCCCLRKLSQLCICMTKTLLRTSTNSLSCMSYISSKLKKKRKLTSFVYAIIYPTKKLSRDTSGRLEDVMKNHGRVVLLLLGKTYRTLITDGFLLFCFLRLLGCWVATDRPAISHPMIRDQ